MDIYFHRTHVNYIYKTYYFVMNMALLNQNYMICKFILIYRSRYNSLIPYCIIYKPELFMNI